MYKTEEIKKRLEPLFSELEPDIVILFGSAVTGKIHKESDIDIAFLCSGDVNILNLTNSVIRLLQMDNVDVVDLKKASPLIKFTVATKGTLLYERQSGLFQSFISLAFRMYIDTKKLREAREQSVRSFINERGLS